MMLFKILTVGLAILLVAETGYVLAHRYPIDRFKVVKDYDYGFVAFDSATGRLCKTLRTKSAAEIKKSNAETAKKSIPCPPLPALSGDPFLDEINRIGISKQCGGSNEDKATKSTDDSMLEVVAGLPACVDIR
jgi:hypothetical protein